MTRFLQVTQKTLKIRLYWNKTNNDGTTFPSKVTIVELGRFVTNSFKKRLITGLVAAVKLKARVTALLAIGLKKVSIKTCARGGKIDSKLLAKGPKLVLVKFKKEPVMSERLKPMPLVSPLMSVKAWSGFVRTKLMKPKRSSTPPTKDEKHVQFTAFHE